MQLTRRQSLALIAAAAVSSLPSIEAQLSVPAARSSGSANESWGPMWQELEPHTPPDWFTGAKFGIFFHWGLYSVPAFGGPKNLGEWYSHNMYLTDTPEYQHHIATYGPLSRFGYKDFAPLFTAERWNPDEWVELFQNAGARYVGMVAEHADGFSMWHSQVNPYNAAKLGPRRDLLGGFAKAVRHRNLKLLTSLHHHWLWGWYSSQDPNADIYHPDNAGFYWPHPHAGRGKGAFDFKHPVPPPSAHFSDVWLTKFTEVVDGYHPDAVYIDSRANIIPEEYRFRALAHLYRSAAARNQKVVMTYKNSDLPVGAAVYDCEAGQLAGTASFVWQTDDVMDWNSWAYMKKPDYKSANRILRQLIDIVSKNGNLLLDVGPRPDGTMPTEIAQRLGAIGAWMRTNGEAIYDTRPWTRFGEGPTVIKEGQYVADHLSDFGSRDIRFTTTKHALYALVLDNPGASVTITSIKRDTPLVKGALEHVELLGQPGVLQWSWGQEGLTIQLPPHPQDDTPLVLRLT